MKEVVIFTFLLQRKIITRIFKKDERKYIMCDSVIKEEKNINNMIKKLREKEFKLKT
jgi:hypothetical protein